MICGTQSFSRVVVLNLVLLWTRVVFSGNLCSCLKEFNPLVMFALERGMALEPMQGDWSSSRVDLRYTELFPVASVTSGYL